MTVRGSIAILIAALTFCNFSCGKMPKAKTVTESENATVSLVHHTPPHRSDTDEVKQMWMDHLQGKWCFFAAEYSTAPGHGPLAYTFADSRVAIEYESEFKAYVTASTFDIDVTTNPVALLIQSDSKDQVRIDAIELRGGDQLWIGPAGFKRVAD